MVEVHLYQRFVIVIVNMDVSSFDSSQSASLVLAFLGGGAISVEEASVRGTPEEGKQSEEHLEKVNN